MRIYTHDPHKGKPILAGHLNGVIFKKTVDSNKHKLRTFDAYGIQEDVINRLSDLQGLMPIWVVIQETDTGKDYRSLLDDWLSYGVTRDFGNGFQRFLGLNHMNKPPKPKQAEQVKLPI